MNQSTGKVTDIPTSSTAAAGAIIASSNYDEEPSEEFTSHTTVTTEKDTVEEGASEEGPLKKQRVSQTQAVTTKTTTTRERKSNKSADPAASSTSTSSSTTSSSELVSKDDLQHPDAIFFKANNSNGYALFSNFWPHVEPAAKAAAKNKIKEVTKSATAAASATSSSSSSSTASEKSILFMVDGMAYKSVEHYYQAAKFQAEFPAAAKQIRDTATSLDAKKLNTQLKKTYHVDPNWFNLSNTVAVMYTGVKAKFTQNADLKAVLLSTGNRVLHERRGRSKDIWCFQPDPNAEGETDHLGKILMRVRQELREGK